MDYISVKFIRKALPNYTGNSLSFWVGGKWVDIELTYTSSNLKKGKIMYLVCSVLQTRCRRLYYHDGQFKSRKATGVLYASQMVRSAKAGRDIDKRNMYRSKINALDKNPYYSYKGKETKRGKRYDYYLDKLNYYQWEILEDQARRIELQGQRLEKMKAAAEAHRERQRKERERIIQQFHDMGLSNYVDRIF